MQHHAAPLELPGGVTFLQDKFEGTPSPLEILAVNTRSDLIRA